MESLESGTPPQSGELNVEIRTHTRDQITIVELVGDIDGNTAPEAQAKILTQADKPGSKLILDMGGVAYMSSAGLRLLLVMYRKIVGKGGKVVVANIPPNIASTMDATGFLDLLMHRESVDAGIAALA
jgi:anti-sigma B factor antagonist